VLFPPLEQLTGDAPPIDPNALVGQLEMNAQVAQ
jgi:hypothetical protein